MKVEMGCSQGEERARGGAALKSRYRAKHTPLPRPVIERNGARASFARVQKQRAMAVLKEFRGILHEAGNAVTALSLRLENLAGQNSQAEPLKKSIETLQRLANRLNDSLEKFRRLTGEHDGSAGY